MTVSGSAELSSFHTFPRRLSAASTPDPCREETSQKLPVYICADALYIRSVRVLCSLFDHGLCTALYEEMLENPEAIVTSVRENIRRKWKPRPLATVELQTLASRKLHMSSERTMSVAEELYNAGIIRHVHQCVLYRLCSFCRHRVCAWPWAESWGSGK